MWPRSRRALLKNSATSTDSPRSVQNADMLIWMRLGNHAGRWAQLFSGTPIRVGSCRTSRLLSAVP